MTDLRCFQIHPDDNVATLLDDLDAPAPLRLLNSSSSSTLTAREPIQLGHKIALTDIAMGAAITKYGVPIGSASRPIPAGAWVHLHNCTSGYDARSQTLDVHTGATTDTKYE